MAEASICHTVEEVNKTIQDSELRDNVQYVTCAKDKNFGLNGCYST
jgi:hypothetical protein